MEKEVFIDEISRRFPESGIETIEDAIHRCKDTEYEYIFSAQIEELERKLWHEKRIKERASYTMFENILKAFRIDEKTGLQVVHFELDSRNKYGTRTASGYARESLTMLIKEEKL